MARTFEHAVVGAGDLAILVFGGDDGRAVGDAVDGDGDRGGGLVTILVREGVAEGVAQCLALVQGLHVLLAVVQLIGVAAVGSDGDLAVGSGDRGAHVAAGHMAARCLDSGLDAGDRGCISAQLVLARAGTGDDVAVHRDAVFGNGVSVRLGHGGGVDDLDDQVVAGGHTGHIGDGDGEAVPDGVVTGAVVVGTTRLLVSVSDLAGDSVVAGDAQDALVGGDDDRAGSGGTGDILAADGDASDAGFGGDGHGAGDGVARTFDHAVVGAGDLAILVLGGDDGRAVVSACHDHDHDLGIGATVSIVNRHFEALFPLFTFTQGLNCWGGAIQRINPLTVLVDFKFSVLALSIFNGPLVCVRGIHIRHGQLTFCDQDSIFLDACRHVTCHGRGVVGADHRNRQGARRGVACRISDGVDIGFGQRLADGQRLHR